MIGVRDAGQPGAGESRSKRALPTYSHTHMHIDATLTHTLSQFTYASAAPFIILYILVTFTHMFMLYYRNYLIPLHIDSVLVLLVYSLVIFLCYYFLFYLANIFI